MTFCWVCPDCGWKTESTGLGTPDCDPCWDAFPCQGPSDVMRRDYRAEAVGIGSGVRVSRGKDREDTHAFSEFNEAAAAAEGI